jgi:type I protein arginine methyltransferase
MSDIHETMLKDTVRTDAYRDFIYNNKHLFAGKVVLDIGCGTGILSMFCAKAGASQVIAVDASDIIDKARENVFRNGLDKIIRCLHGRMEEVVLPVDKVDIIVSEWMGYCLLYEAMLPTVLWARDRYLKPDGLLVPSHASLWIAPVSDPEYVAENVDFWRDVYGFDLVAMQANIYDNVRIQTLPPTSLAGDPHCFRLLDLYKISPSDLTFVVPWSSGPSSAATSAEATDGHVDGFLIWFDIFFTASDKEASTVTPQISAQAWTGVGSDASIAFTTGPSGKETHWQQGLCLRPTPAVSRQAEDERPNKTSVISGQVEFAISEDNERGLVIHISWQAESKRTAAGHAEVPQSQSWQLR